MHTHAFLLSALIAASYAPAGIDALIDNCPADASPRFPVTETALDPDWLSAITSLFPESMRLPDDPDHPLGADALAASVSSSITFKVRSTLTITFVHEGAGYRNEFGVMDLATRENTVVFPDLSLPGPGCIESGDTVVLGPYDAGTTMAFTLKGNGFNNPNGHLWSTEADSSPDGKQHVVTVYDDQYDVLLVGIEDLWNLGDADYNDALFFAKVQPVDASEGVKTSDAIDVTDKVTTSDGQATACRDAGLAGKTHETASAVIGVTETGTEFSLVDGTDLDEIRQAGMTRKWAIPGNAGASANYGPWNLAEDNGDFRSHIPLREWGTACLALAETQAVSPDLASCSAEASVATEVLNDLANCVSVDAAASKAVVSRSAVSGVLPPVNSQAQAYGSGYTMSGVGVYQVVPDPDNGNAGVRIPVLGPFAPELHEYGFSACAKVRADSCSYNEGASSRSMIGVAADVFFTDSTSILGTATRAQIGTHGEELVCVDIGPLPAGKTVDHVGIHGIMRGEMSGTAYFSDFSIQQRDGNLIVNVDGHVQGRPDLQGEQICHGWNPFKSGYTRVELPVGAELPPITSSSRTAMCMTAVSEVEVHGAEQIVKFDPPVAGKVVYIGVESRAEGVTKTSDRYSSLHMDIYFADDSDPIFGMHVRLPTGTETAFAKHDRLFQIPAGPDGTQRPISKINIVGLFAGHAGTMCMRNFQLRVRTTGSASGDDDDAPNAAGDPHYRTFSGTTFDLQTIGEFVAYKDNEIELQVRHSAAGQAAVASAVVLKAHGSKIMLERGVGTADPVLRVNGGRLSLSDGASFVGLPADEGAVAGVRVSRMGAQAGSEKTSGIPLRYTLTARSQSFSEGSYVVNVDVFLSEFNVQYLSVRLTNVPSGAAAAATGLFTLSEDDLGVSRLATMARSTRSRRLASLQAVAKTEVAHRVVGPKYAVSSTDSAFSYEKGQSAATLSDPESAERFLNTISSASYQDDITAAAAGPCAAVPDAEERTKCAEDYVLSGGDSGFVTTHIISSTSSSELNSKDVTTQVEAAAAAAAKSDADSDTSSATSRMPALSCMYITFVSLVFVFLF